MFVSRLFRKKESTTYLPQSRESPFSTKYNKGFFDCLDAIEELAGFILFLLDLLPSSRAHHHIISYENHTGFGRTNAVHTSLTAIARCVCTSLSRPQSSIFLPGSWSVQRLARLDAQTRTAQIGFLSDSTPSDAFGKNSFVCCYTRYI